MTNLYARPVFFVSDTERSLRFFVDQLGFSEDWAYKEEDRVYVCQVLWDWPQKRQSTKSI